MMREDQKLLISLQQQVDVLCHSFALQQTAELSTVSSCTAASQTWPEIQVHASATLYGAA